MRTIPHESRHAAAFVLIGALCVSLAGCAALASDRGDPKIPAAPLHSPADAAENPPATQGPPAAPRFPSPRPGVTADAASMSVARNRLATVDLPPGAVRASSRPEGAPTALAMGFWCQPMAHVTGFWSVPGASEDSVVDYLKTHTPPGLTFEEATGSNATGEAHVEVDLIEYSATKDAQNGLTYEVVPRESDVVIRADSFEVPSNAVCATAPPGTALGYWGG